MIVSNTIKSMMKEMFFQFTKNTTECHNRQVRFHIFEKFFEDVALSQETIRAAIEYAIKDAE